MSRRSGSDDYLRVRHHESDRNIPGLIGDLDSDDPVIRSHVANVLASLGASEAAAHLARLADDPEKNVRMSAYVALGDLRAREFIDVLRQGLDDPVPVVRMGASRGLQEMRDPSAVPLLRSALSSEADPEVRFCLGRALVALRDRDVVKDLPEILRATPRRIHFSSEWKDLKRVADSGELPPTS